jgi:hypothetical protein
MFTSKKYLTRMIFHKKFISFFDNYFSSALEEEEEEEAAVAAEFQRIVVQNIQRRRYGFYYCF